MTIQQDIQIGQITEALNNKIDLPVGSNQGDVSIVIETYQNGTSWYKIYSDGWCEMGGILSSASSSTTIQTVNYLKTFQDTNYDLQITIGSTNDNWSVIFAHIGYQSKTVSGFNVAIANTYEKNWQASGYLAEGEY